MARTIVACVTALALSLTGGAIAQAYDKSHYFPDTRMRVSYDTAFRVTADGKDDVYELKVFVKDRKHRLTEIVECVSDVPDDEACEFYSIASKADRAADYGTRWKKTKRGWIGTLDMGIYDGGADQAYCDDVNLNLSYLEYAVVMQSKDGKADKFVSLAVPIKCQLST